MSPTVEIAFDLSANGVGDFFTLDDTTRGELDNVTYVLGGDVFVDVTDRVRSLRVARGRSSLLSRFTSATGQIVLDNRDRAFDPTNGPNVEYDDTGTGYDADTAYDTGTPYYGQIVPRKQVRITDGTQTIAVLQVEDWDLDYTMAGDSVATVALTDGLATLANATLGSAVNSPQTTGARVATVLDAVDWPAGQRSIDTGVATVDGDTITDGTGALAYLQKVEASEPGALFIGKDGTLTFRDRATLQAFTAQSAAFGDGGIPFSEPFAVVYGTNEMVNRAVVTYAGGTATVDDAASQASYGILARTVDTLLSDPDDATALGQWIVGQSAQPRVRVRTLTIKRGAPTVEQFDEVLALELGDAASVTWTPNARGNPIVQVVSIDQIEHQVDRGGTVHTVTLTLSQTTSGFILDDSAFGVLDTSTLGF